MKHAPGFLALCDDARSRIREMDVPTLLERLARGDRLEVVDVREDREWDAGHVKGAHHLGRGVLERDAEATWPDKGVELVLYCGGGFRSALAADNLQKMGFQNVWSLAGGWRAWNEAGGPVE